MTSRITDLAAVRAELVDRRALDNQEVELEIAIVITGDRFYSRPVGHLGDGRGSVVGGIDFVLVAQPATKRQNGSRLSVKSNDKPLAAMR